MTEEAPKMPPIDFETKKPEVIKTPAPATKAIALPQMPFIMPDKTVNVTGNHFLYDHAGDYDLLHIAKDLWQECYDTDVTKHIEKTYTGAWYLSWSYAWMFLRTKFPDLEIYWERDWDNGGRFYFRDEQYSYCLAFLLNSVTGARSLPTYYPILDSKNKGVQGVPSPMALNKSLRRAAVKAIAEVTGLGLRLWTGEDLDNTQKSALIERIKQVNSAYRSKTNGDHELFAKVSLGLSEEELTSIGKQMAKDVQALAEEEDSVKKDAAAEVYG